jgi:DNA polymerase III delta subunit
VIAYVGDNENIHDADVRASVAPEQDYNVYQLVDAVVAGDSGGALRQLRTLTSRNDKIEGQAFSRVFPTLAKQFRLIWQARLCLDANCRPSDPTPGVLAMMPSKPRLSDEKDWVQKRAMGSARRLSLGQVRQVFAELGDADAKIKGLEPSYSTQESVEEMVLKMAAVCRSR